MKILSIDTCTEIISISLIAGEVVTEKFFPSGKDYSGKILPEIKMLLSESNLKIEDIGAIAFPYEFINLKFSTTRIIFINKILVT